MKVICHCWWSLRVNFLSLFFLFAFFYLGLFLFGFVLTETFFLDEESSAGLVTCSQGDGLWAIPVPGSRKNLNRWQSWGHRFLGVVN